jgi:hypothetical protein
MTENCAAAVVQPLGYRKGGASLSLFLSLSLSFSISLSLSLSLPCLEVIHSYFLMQGMSGGRCRVWR